MQCDQFEQILEQQGDGVLPETARAHLESCQACRALSADLSALQDLALTLDNEAMEPPERVWISLRNQLEAEGILRAPGVDSQIAGRARIGWWTVFQRPAVAGVFLALVLAAASAISFWSDFLPQTSMRLQFAPPQTTSPVPDADSVFKEEVQTVGSDSIPGLRTQNAAVTNSIRRNLQIVDNFIAMCEKSVREQPDNPMAREYLYGAYQQKAELLATAMNRSMAGGLQ